MHVNMCTHVCMHIHIIHMANILLYLNLQGSRFLIYEDGTDRLSQNVGFEMSIINCHSMLHNIPEAGRCHLHHGGSLKSHTVKWL